MNITNNLYNLSLNLKTTKKEEEKKEEKRAEVKPEVAAKVPEEKKITASVADIVAEMNKSLVKGPGAPQAKAAEEENEIDVAQLISQYYRQKNELLRSRIIPTEEQISTIRELINLASQIKEILPSEDTSSADINPNNWGERWQREIDYWTYFLENNGGRSIEEEGVDRTMRAGREYTLNTSELSEKAHQLWTKVLGLLDQYHIEYDTTINFEDPTYGESTWENREFVRPFIELGTVLNPSELEEIRRMVTDILRLFEGGTFDNNSDLGKFSKHALQYGIIACLLDPNGINPHILH